MLRFGRFAITVSTERVGWWIERQFYPLISLNDPRGTQTPAPHPSTCESASSDVCASINGPRSAQTRMRRMWDATARVVGAHQLYIDGRVPFYRKGWGVSRMIVAAASLAIYTPCTPLPAPFARSRHMKPLKWSVLRSTVDSRAHLRRFG